MVHALGVNRLSGLTEQLDKAHAEAAEAARSLELAREELGSLRAASTAEAARAQRQRDDARRAAAALA